MPSRADPIVHTNTYSHGVLKLDNFFLRANAPKD